VRFRQIKLLLVIISLTVATQTQALSRKVWDSYNEREQMIHLVGAFEGLMIDPSPHEVKLFDCFKETKTDIVQLHELVVENYNLSFWKHSNQDNIPASIVLLSALKTYCIAKGYEFD
jgi:hypothetical protein